MKTWRNHEGNTFTFWQVHGTSRAYLLAFGQKGTSREKEQVWIPRSRIVGFRPKTGQVGMWTEVEIDLLPGAYVWAPAFTPEEVA